LARLYANENFPLPTVEALRQLGHDVQTSQDAGRANRKIPDEEVLEYAIAESRALVTLNRRHFVKLHESKPTHSGIIVCTFDPDFKRQATRIHAAIVGLNSLNGTLLRVNRD
jgi:predicted nuclease of predicted toxin-antitoxin system